METDSQRPLTPAPGGMPGWRAVAGNSIWLLCEKAARLMAGLVVGVWLARHLGPHGFGSLNAATAWAALFASVAGFGVEAIVVRELIRRPKERNAILATATGLRCLGGAGAAAAAVLFAAAIPSASPPVELAAIAALITLFSLSDVFDLWFQAHMQARMAAVARTAAFAVATTARIILIVQDAPVSAFLWLSAGEALLVSVLLGLLLLRDAGSSGMRFSAGIARDLVRESWPNIIANIAGIAYLRADRVMLASINGEAAAGVYSAAASLVEVWYVLPIALVNSATPMLTNLHGNDPARFRLEFWRLARFNAALAWTIALGLAIGAMWFVPMLYGAPYVSAVPVLALLAFCLPFSFLGLATVPVYLNERLVLPAMRRHLCGGILNILLNLLLIPRWGAMGAATATVVAFAVAHVLTNALDPRTRHIFHFQWRALCFRPPPPL